MTFGRKLRGLTRPAEAPLPAGAVERRKFGLVPCAIDGRGTATR